MATRAEIEARMADILDRTDFTTRITIWFDRAYKSIQRRFDFKCMEATEQFAGTPGTYQVAAPSDIKKSRLLYLADPVTGCPVTRFRETLVEEVRGSLGPGGCDCEPIFTNWYNSLLFAPAMSTTSLTLRYDYVRFLTPTDNDWFMTHAEDWLVYRGLAESAPFLAADPRLQVWQAFAKEIWDELWKMDQNQQVGGPLWLRG